MRNHQFIVLILAILMIVLHACAPYPASKLGGTTSTVRPEVQTKPVETPAAPPMDPTSTIEIGSVSKTDQEPFLLVGTWKAKGGLGSASIFPFDPSSGEPLPGYEPIAIKENGFVNTYSQDGKRLAVVAFQGQSCDSFSGGSRCRGGRGELHLVDLPTWQVLSASLPVDGFIQALAFNSDASLLAVAASSREGYDLVLLDGTNGETITQRSLDFPAELLAFTADRASLVVYGTPVNEPAGMAMPDPPRAALLDAASLETRWEQELPEVTSGSWCLENCESSHEMVLFANYQPGVALSPAGQRLYLVHPDEERLTTVDFAAQDILTINIAKEASWFERLLAWTAGVAQAKGRLEGAMKQAALSADGRVLYVTGQAMHAEPDEQFGWLIEQEALPVQAIETDTGRLLATVTLDRQGIYQLKLSPDGAFLILQSWGENQVTADILDAETLEPVAEVKGWNLQAVRGPDGALTWIGSRSGPSLTTLAVLDPETFEPLNTWRENGYWLAP